MNVIYTTNKNAFDSIGAPILQQSEIRDFSYPTALVFGKTYYTEKNGHLVAFKVLAAAYVNSEWQRANCVKFHSDFYCRLAFFVQYANQSKPIWELGTLDYPCFESVENYLNHANGKMGSQVDFNKMWLTDLVRYVDKKHIEVKTYSHSNDEIRINKTFCWDNNIGKPYAYSSLLDSVVFTNEGMIVCTNPKLNTCKRPINGFNTYEECMADHLDGLDVVDFEESVFSFNVEIKVTTPKTHLIQVVEVEE